MKRWLQHRELVGMPSIDSDPSDAPQSDQGACTTRKDEQVQLGKQQIFREHKYRC